MSLFDLTPLTAEQVAANQQTGQGETIRKLSSRGPGPGVWRTVRHKPWWMLIGKGLEGEQCKDCAFLLSTGNAGKYKKCGKQNITAGTGTDIRVSDPACKLFNLR